MALNTGTLITSAIRPNDSNDPIASAYSSEIKGGIHSVNSIIDRNNIIIERRDWGMLSYVKLLDKTYQLKYNHVNTDINDNLNWVENNLGNDNNVSTEWIDSVIEIRTDEPSIKTSGDRYLLGTNPSDSLSGSWSSLFTPGTVVEWNSVTSSWDETIPTNGMSLRVDNEDFSIYKYEGNNPTGFWEKERNTQVISINAASNNGINFTSNSYYPFENYKKDVIILTTFDNPNIIGTQSILPITTININGLGDVEIKNTTRNGLERISQDGDISPGKTYTLIFNGTTFELIKHYNDYTRFDIKYYIEDTEHIIIPPYHQYWVYGDLTIAGEITNYGNIVVANGSIIFEGSGTIYEEGDGFITMVSLSESLVGLSPLSVMDFETGSTFNNIANITFRGGSVTTPQGNSDSVSVLDDDNLSDSVVVWIPAPSYSDYFNPNLFEPDYDRFISKPTINSWTQSNINGNFGVGNWNTFNDYFFNNRTRKVFNTGGIKTLFSDSNFACYDDNTNIVFSLYNDIELIESVSYVINGIGTISSNGITINVTNFETDSDRFKASVNGTIDVDQLFLNGGRFKWVIEHYNNQGPGNTGIQGLYRYNSDDIFYDSPNQLSSNSTSSIDGSVNFSEDLSNLKYYSGVAFYDIGSSFFVNSQNINLLNSLTFPESKQVDIITNNMAITDIKEGYADGNKAYGDLLTGWNIDWNNSVNFNSNLSVDETDKYIPNFTSNYTNEIDLTPNTYITSNIYDYGLSQTKDSNKILSLFDTYSGSGKSYDKNDLISENGRIYSTATYSIIQFDSSLFLPQDELQFIFGKIVYPKYNFNNFNPPVNTNVDYTLSGGSNKTFNVLSNLNFIYNETQEVTLNDYRWFVSSYGKNSNYSVSFSNGIFYLDSNFLEEDLHYNGLSNSNGSEDLAILIGIDSSGLNLKPDKFIFISGNYTGRLLSIEHNLNNSVNKDKSISFHFGTLPFFPKKIWLFIGYKNSNRGKQLVLNSISLI